jgi:hypothetical protein
MAPLHGQGGRDWLSRPQLPCGAVGELAPPDGVHPGRLVTRNEPYQQPNFPNGLSWAAKCGPSRWARAASWRLRQPDVTTQPRSLRTIAPLPWLPSTSPS